jgi:hypothetical protein
VCLPDIDLSSDLMDFGSVMLGRSRQVYVMLTNSRYVHCTYTVPTLHFTYPSLLPFVLLLSFPSISHNFSILFLLTTSHFYSSQHYHLIHLHKHHSDVISKWELSIPQGKDENKFTVNPNSGNLRPGKIMLECVD